MNVGQPDFPLFVKRVTLCPEAPESQAMVDIFLHLSKQRRRETFLGGHSLVLDSGAAPGRAASWLGVGTSAIADRHLFGTAHFIRHRGASWVIISVASIAGRCVARRVKGRLSCFVAGRDAVLFALGLIPPH